MDLRMVQHWHTKALFKDEPLAQFAKIKNSNTCIAVDSFFTAPTSLKVTHAKHRPDMTDLRLCQVSWITKLWVILIFFCRCSKNEF
ncbi:protein of unknown function [Magnetospira sp. QH-2]|nr:protein of unknown function [Magnetospira sp. QH-2]